MRQDPHTKAQNMLNPDDHEEAIRHREDQLDEALAEAFPAGDPLPLSLPA
jgi:hypothetical protein